MLVSLDGKVPEDLGVVIPVFFLVLPTSLYCAQDRTQHILLCLLVYSVPASLLQPLVICATVSACCLHNLHLGSCTVDLVCHCPGVEGLLLSCHDQSLGVCFDVAFIEQLKCAGHVCNF